MDTATPSTTDLREKQILADRAALEAEKDVIASVKARVENEERELNQRRLKLDAQDEALQKKESHIAILESSIRNDREILHTRQEELNRAERQVRDRQTSLEAAEASFIKQQQILKDLEKKAQDARDEASKEAAANVAALVKVEKEKARLAKAAEDARRFYEMAKGVRNQLIPMGGSAANEVTNLLNRAFAAMGLEIPADVPPAP